MNPEDDPEARIRELERPLEDVARASEMGATQSGAYSYQPGGDAYSYQPGGDTYPTAPPSYHAPYPGARPRSSTGNRAFWILAAVIVVGVLAVVGGIIAFTANRISDGFAILSPTPSTSALRNTPSSPAPSASEVEPPTEKPATPIPPAGGRLSVSGVNVDKTLTCNDSIVSVSGVSNRVIITGHCARLTVSGMQNSVTVDAADTITASGLNNEVTYHSGSPKITNSGGSNVVEQG